MEEALEILWTYARRQAIDCNGKVVIPTINQSIAAIRLIIRLEGARKNNEKKVKSKASENLELGHRREERKVMKEERRVINVADYAPFEEEEEEEEVDPPRMERRSKHIHDPASERGKAIASVVQSSKRPRAASPALTEKAPKHP